MRLDFCAACGAKEELHNHHLIPLSLGGTRDEKNTITLCNECHGIMHSQPALPKSELTKIGQAKARARGVKFGRRDGPFIDPAKISAAILTPGISYKKKRILECFLNGFHYATIGKEYGVNHNAIARIVKKAAGVEKIQ